MQAQPETRENSQGIRGNETMNVELGEGKRVRTAGFRHRRLKERAAAHGGELGLAAELDWGEAAGSEAWA